MALLGVRDVEYCGFQRKLAFYLISCEDHFEEGYCECTDVDDCSKLEHDPNKCDWRQRLRSSPCRRFTPATTFSVFKSNFCKRDFRDFASISVRFMFNCECHTNCLNLMELSELLHEKEDLYNTTKIIGITRNQDRYHLTEKNRVYDELETKAIEKLMKINNLFFVAHELPAWKDDFYDVYLWWYKLRNRMTRLSLQEATTTIQISAICNVECQSTAADLYAEVINPALVLIVNHNTFPDEKLNRVGSLEDAKNLSLMFSRKNIPQIVIRDSQVDHDDAVFNFLSHGNLKGLKELYVFIMSHGYENDIILSGDKKYAIYERIKQVVDNPCLKDVNKFFFIVACRGGVNPFIEIPEDSEKTDASMLDENTIVVHSTPKNLVSPRNPQKGTPFIQHLCEIYKKPFHTLSFDEFVTKMDERLEKCTYYSEYEGKRFEVVKHDRTVLNLGAKFVKKQDCICLEDIAVATTTEKFVYSGMNPSRQEKIKLDQLSSSQEQEDDEADEDPNECKCS